MGSNSFIVPEETRVTQLHYPLYKAKSRIGLEFSIDFYIKLKSEKLILIRDKKNAVSPASICAYHFHAQNSSLQKSKRYLGKPSEVVFRPEGG